MRYEIIPSRHVQNEWRVEAIDRDKDGDCYVTIFSGHAAKQRAEEYAAWKNQEAFASFK